MSEVSSDKPVPGPEEPASVASTPPSAPPPVAPGLVPTEEEKVQRQLVPHMDDSQEVDIWWGSYAGRSMWPSFLACLLLTGGLAWGAWYLWSYQDFHPQLLRLGVYCLAAWTWLIQLIRLGYRTVTFNYRLTTARLFLDRGIRRPRGGYLDLVRIRTVEVKRTASERLAGVGDVHVSSEDGSHPPLVLQGVYRPEGIAAMISNCVREARRQAGLPDRLPFARSPGKRLLARRS